MGDDSIILDVHDVGYRILLSPASIAFLPQIGEEVKLYTYTSVREDAIWLYGFLNHEDLEIFKKCITVSGIGPKGGMSILSVMDADALRKRLQQLQKIKAEKPIRGVELLKRRFKNEK